MSTKCARQHAGPKGVAGEAVVAIKIKKARAGRLGILSLAALAFCSLSLLAAVLPEDRFDALYHSYEGGGIKVTGPSYLLRKHLGPTSIWGNYYVDAISSASIDVVTSATPYKERRIEKSAGIDYLQDKTLMGLAFTTSKERDYDSNTASFSISQDMFGDLSTVSLSYSIGRDKVGRRNQPDFSQDLDRYNFGVGVSQIVTRNLLLNLNWETITNEGFLNNPYRSVRYLDSSSVKGYSFEPEVYPRTRTSNAVSLRGRYFLPYRAALHAGYRWFSDSWGISADTFEAGYTHTTAGGWIVDLDYRLYRQNHADFYSDLFSRQDAQNFMARDKQLATFTTTAVGVGVSYELTPASKRFIDKGSLTFSFDHIRYAYDDFRDLRATTAPGKEPLYGFTANVIQLYMSLWY